MISDKWKFDTTQDWEFLAKNFDQVSNELIAEADLLRLDIYISAPGYLEEGRPRFTEVMEEYKEESNRDDAEEEPTDSEEEAIKKKAQCKEKRDARTASLAVPRSFRCLPVPGSSAPPSPSASGVRVPGSSAPSASSAPVPGSSTPPSPSGRLPVPGSSAAPPGSSAPPPGSSAPPSPSASGVRVPGSSAPSASGVPVPGSSAPSSPFGCLPMPGSSAPSPSGCLPVPGSSPPFPNWSSPQTPTLVPGKRRLGQWDRIIKRASSEEALPTFARLLPPMERPSPPLFPSNSPGEKRLFDKAFNLDSRPLADDRTGEEVDLSFAGYQCPPAVKANRLWQQELLDRKLVCIVEAIPLAMAIFWDLGNFVLCARHTLNLAKKLGLKTKNLKTVIVKERIEQIWANRTLARLDELFANNPDWWNSTAVIFSQVKK